jgi:hypothetical protein
MACVILILCWLCGTRLLVWRVMPISDIDDEAMALFVRKMGKFMKKTMVQEREDITTRSM